MKLTWKFHYVNEGQLEPDKHNRWACVCYGFLDIDKSLPQYKKFKKLYPKYMPIRLVTILRKGAMGREQDIGYLFSCIIPSFRLANLGFKQIELGSNNLEDLQKQVEKELRMIHKCFKYCK